jgi:hypothetical protein
MQASMDLLRAYFCWACVGCMSADVSVVVVVVERLSYDCTMYWSFAPISLTENNQYYVLLPEDVAQSQGSKALCFGSHDTGAYCSLKGQCLLTLPKVRAQ